MIGDLVGGQNLDRHRAIEMGVPRLVDHTHPAFTELRFDPVMAERLADHDLLASLGDLATELGNLWRDHIARAHELLDDAGVRDGLADHEPSPMRRSKLAKRGSARRPSNRGSTFSRVIAEDRSSKAFSSHSKARSL